jgi:hypothetical protein
VPEGNRTSGPHRRGRRNPQVAQAIAENNQLDPEDLGDSVEEFMAEDDLNQPDSVEFVRDGDVTFCKVSHSVSFMGDESWVTYGVAGRLHTGESEEDNYRKRISVAAVRALDAVRDTYGLEMEEGDDIVAVRERLREIEREIRSQRRIQPQ